MAWLLVLSGRKRSGRPRAMLTGCASGLIFGIADALTRSAVRTLSGHAWLATLTGWPAYCLIIASLAGMWLMESSFSAAPLNASLPAITAAEPVTGMALGVLVFGDVIRTSAALIAVQAAGMVAMIAGVIMVARAPAFRALHPDRIVRAGASRLAPRQGAAYRMIMVASARGTSSPMTAAPGISPATSRPPEV